MKRIISVGVLLLIPVFAFGATAKKQSAIQNGTSVRARVPATGIYSSECYEAYYGCMDEFCISENVNGGSCLCSNDNAKYESQLKEIEELLAEAERIRTIEVEKINLGANVDIVFSGGRVYDDKGNVVYGEAMNSTGTNMRQAALDMFNQSINVEDDEEDDDSIMKKRGAALFRVADEACQAQIGDNCTKDLKLLRQVYQRQIISDCRGFANSINQQLADAKSALNAAESDVRNALKASFDSANKYNQGECMVEFKNCMLGADACGTDWVNCVSTIASENMQNKKVKDSVANETIAHIKSYKITDSVAERLESKRTICERVLDQCMAVRDNVWDAFLREVAPSLKMAELRAESNMRQSCLTDITQCLHKACKDDIAGKGVATMDACLSRPEMAKAFCKVQLEPCERMAGNQLWDYIRDKLLAMRVDSCTAEVKECFTDEGRCGSDFMNCIGMDYDFIRGICPLDKLVACKAYDTNGDNKFTMDDIDSIITGLYLNMDNKALDNCQKLVDDKMMQVCGSTTDCNKFASDDTIGIGSLRMQKDKNIYRITGMISFGSLPISSDKDDYGHVNVEEYIANVEKFSEGMKGLKGVDVNGIIDSIRAELNDVAGNINRVIDMIESDPKIQYCVTGRNLEQITGETDKTAPRFPNLLNQVKMQIAIAALRQAQNNYQTKYNELLTKATKDASADIAQYICQMLPVSGGAPIGGVANQETALNPPYAILYEVGAGLDNTLLAQGGRGSSVTSSDAHVDFSSGTASEDGITKGARVIGAIASLGLSEAIRGGNDTGIPSYDIPGGKREMWATFNRETRVCRLCSSTVMRDCVSTYKNGLAGIGRKTEFNCTESEPIEKCDDIEM